MNDINTKLKNKLKLANKYKKFYDHIREDLEKKKQVREQHNDMYNKLFTTTTIIKKDNKTVKTIYHFADIHIRQDKSRIKEYTSVFKYDAFIGFSSYMECTPNTMLLYT